MFLALTGGGTFLRFAITPDIDANEQQLDAALFSTNVWKHIAVRLKGDSAQIYIDGTAVATSTTLTNNPSILGNTANNFIGKSQYPVPYLDGAVDDFRIYDYALTPAEIASLYSSTKPVSFTWDNSTTSGIQTGSGTWGTDSYWSPDGYSLVAWPGAGNSATFDGADGSYTITVNGTQNVDSIAFSNDGYTLSSGTVNLGTKNGLYVASGKTGTINSVISGSNGIKKYGTGQLTLAGSNTFTGASTLTSGKTVLLSASALGATSEATTVNSGAVLILQGSLTFANEALYLNGTGVDGSALRTPSWGSHTVTWPGNITLQSASTISAYTATAVLTLSGVIDGNYQLTTGGSGTIILSGSNTYSGGTKISTGTLKAGASNTLPSTTVITIGNNDANDAVFDLNGYNQTIGGLVEGGSTGGTKGITNNGSGQATLTINNSSDYSFGYVVTNADSALNLTKDGTGTLTLSGTNITYTGVSTISNGTLAFSDAANFANGSSPASFSIASGATLEIDVSVSQAIGSNYASGTVISGTGTFQKSGFGALSLGGQGTSAYKVYFNMTGGLIDIQAGTLLNGGWAGGQWTNNKASMNIASGARFDIWDGNDVYVDALTGDGTLDKGQTATGTQTMIVGVNNGSGTFSGTITQSAGASYPLALTKTGSGQQDLSGNNSYTGATTVSAGKLVIYNANALGDTSGATTVNDGAALILVGNPVTFAAEHLYINGNGVTVPGALRTSNAGSADTVTWPGNVTLQSNSSLSAWNAADQLTVSGVIDGAYQLTTDGSGIIILSGNNTYTGITTISSGTLQIGNGSTTGNVAGDIANNATLIFNRSNDLTFSNTLSGTGTLTKQGAGTLTLSGTGITYTGNTTVSAGTLALQDATAFANGSSCAGFSIASGSILEFNVTAGDQAIGSTCGGGGTVIDGNGTLRKTGASTLFLGGQGSTGYIVTMNMTGGLIDIQNGTIRNGGWQGGVWTDNKASLNIASGATFDIWDGNAVNVDALTGAGTVTSGATRTLNVGVNNGAGTFSGVIQDGSGTITLTKSGTGQQDLSGANTYTGATTVSGGTLNVTGSLSSSSAVTVASGATLAGTGTVAGTVTVSDNGIISPGDGGIGKLTTGELILNNSSVLNFDLGTLSDTIAVNGNLTLDGVLNIADSAGFSVGSYTLMTYTGTCADSGLSINTVPEGFFYTISVGSNKVTLDVTAPGEMLPITVQNNIGTGTSDTCLVYTDNWSLVFDEDEGGQIKFLSDQPSGGGTNQVWSVDQRNLFSVQFNQGSYDVSGQLELIKSTSFFVLLRNSYTLNSVQFVEEYTVYGSGIMFVRVSAANNSGSSQTQPLSFMVVRDNNGSSQRITKTATASSCPYVLNAETSAGQFDILMAIHNLWSDATGFVNTADNNSYLGYEDNSFTFADKTHRSWEFMIDFANTGISDTSTVTNILSDNFLSPDSLEFLAGTPAMEQSWEHHLRGHWKLDDETGDTARDCSGNNHHGSASGTWTTGKWGGGLQMTSGEQISYPDNSDFDGVGDFTVMTWIKTATLDGSTVIMGKHNGTQGWKLTGNGSGQLTFTLDGTSLHGQASVEDNSWHHVAATRSTDTVKIYVDGIIDTVIAGSYTVTANATALTMGAGYTGTLDDIRFYGEQVSENTLEAIYLLGYRSAMGAYQVRADNNNTVHLKIDGGTTTRYFPVFMVENYWATAKPAVGCVVLNGTALTENTDYFAYFDDTRNELILGLNKYMSSDETRLYIDDSYENGASMVTSTPKMSWGIATVGTVDYFWVKNFSGNTFGSSTSNEWFMNWKMAEGTSSNCGEISFLASSVTDPNSALDTTANTNLIPTSATNPSSPGHYCFLMNSNWPRSTQHSGTFSYAVEESTSTRIMLRINDRDITTGGETYHIVTRYTVYPSGQIFRWDSLSQFSSVPDNAYIGVHLKYNTNGSLYENTIEKRCGIVYSSGYQDLASAWLTFKNADGYQAQPFDSDTLAQVDDGERYGFDFMDQGLPAVWNSTSIQTALYVDLQHSNMTNAFVDSVSNGVQYIGTGGGAALSMINGALDSSTNGDLNADGFNESEGAYIIQADNNTVNFRLPAKNDTCRFYPAFRITGYFAAEKPSYVFAYNGTDTTTLLEGYQYNAYLDKVNRDLVLQIDSIFCDTVGLYISADKTLAVKMSGFWAIGGAGCDTLQWRTESEHENLGYAIYRRIKPAFYDSIMAVIDSVKEDTVSEIVSLLKLKKISGADTVWVRINDKLIPGSPSGASVGPREYQYLDHRVTNQILYEYKLVAIDYSNSTEEFGPIEAMPRALLPLVFNLKNNYPNPFRQMTVIRFELPEKSRISLNVYNIQGRLVRKLITPDKTFQAEFHQVIWDGTDDWGRALAAGPYIYRLTAKKYIKARIMIKLIN